MKMYETYRWAKKETDDLMSKNIIETEEDYKRCAYMYAYWDMYLNYLNRELKGKMAVKEYIEDKFQKELGLEYKEGPKYFEALETNMEFKECIALIFGLQRAIPRVESYIKDFKCILYENDNWVFLTDRNK